MPLQFKNIAVGNLQDDVSGNNYAANKAVYILNLNNTLAQIFSDEAGTVPIVQDGVNNVTGANGVFGFWVEAGDYFVQVGANKYRVSITGADYFNNRIDETVNLIVDAVAGRGAYYPVGSFEAGFTYTDINQVGTFGGTDYYIYTGGLTNLPHSVTAGTDPTLSSDYAQVFYTDHNELTNRNAVGAHPASSITLDNNLSMQTFSEGVSSKRDYQIRNLQYGGLALNGENCISLLGDSISWGQGAVDIRNDSYVGILTKALNYEYGGEYSGFIPLVEGVSDSWDHSVSATGAWSGVSLTNATHIMNGYARTTTSGTARITVTVPVSVSPKCDVWWTRQPSGGTFDVYVNDVFFTTVNTSGGSSKAGWFVSRNIPMTDSGDGNAIISFRPNGDGDVEICGISYGDGAAASFRVQNWSNPGRKARDLSTSVINKAVDGAKTLIFALGHNDQNATGSDLTTALSNIDYVKTACETYGTKLVVLDFIWDKDYTNQVKAKLRDIGESTAGATYIDFSKSLNLDGTLQTSTQLISSGFLIDSSHPSVGGHKTIAESVAKKLFLGVSAKSALETLDNVKTSVQKSELNDFSLSANNGTITGSVSKYKNQGDIITLVCRARFTSVSGSDDIQLVVPSELSPNSAYYTGTGVESQLIPCGIINIGGGGVTNALCQFVSSTIIRIRGTAGLGDNSDVHISINYTK